MELILLEQNDTTRVALRNGDDIVSIFEIVGYVPVQDATGSFDLADGVIKLFNSFVATHSLQDVADIAHSDEIQTLNIF